MEHQRVGAHTILILAFLIENFMQAPKAPWMLTEAIGGSPATSSCHAWDMRWDWATYGGFPFSATSTEGAAFW